MKALTPDQEVNIVAMREAGYTINLIAARNECSPATVKRVCSRHNSLKGALTKEMMDEAKSQLRKSISGDEAIQAIAASVTLDTKYHFELIREKLAEVVSKIEVLSAEDTKTAARTLNSCANTLKLSTDAMRSALKMDTTTILDEEELPVLRVVPMTAEDIAELRRFQLEEEAELYGTDGELVDDIVELH